MPQPKLDTSLLDELAGVFASYPRDDMGLARIERSAREMCTRDPLGGYMTLGACAAVGGDAEAAIRHHEASLRVASGHLVVWCNYMTSLMILGESARVRHLAFEIGKRFRANPNAHSSAVNALVELGLLQSASQFVATFCNQRVNHAESKRIDAVLSARGLNEDDLSAAVVCARRFLAQRGVVRPKFSCEHIEDDVGGPGEIAYGFHVQADPTAAHALECALLEYLCEARMSAEEAGAVTFFIEGLFQESQESANADTTR
jgi:hypothetical protein